MKRNGSGFKVLALVALACAGSTVAVADDAAVYVAGTQYTAAVDLQRGQWHLTPLDGHHLRIDAEQCGAVLAVPHGVWLIERDGAGNPELRAPSTTALPQGHPGVVALRACGDDTESGTPTLRAPQSLLDVLVASAGAVYVHG